ncbi:MAG: hypothetical protein GF334_09295 [Candidatus Altiarchaeales archaeon]|nr:hypothetical protein [Candidatus Altiarchaeales archaeon]
MPEIRKVVNLKTVDAKETKQLIETLDGIELKGTKDELFGPLRRGEGVSDEEWVDERRWRIRGVKALHFLRNRASMRYAVENWDKLEAGETPDDISHMQYLQSLVDIDVNTPQQFFKRLRRTLNRAIRIEDKDEGGQRILRKPRVEDTHEAFEIFDRAVKDLNTSLPQDQRIKLEHRIPVQSTSRHTIEFGRAWWYEPDVPVPNKVLIPSHKIGEELQSLGDFRQKAYDRQVWLHENEQTEVNKRFEARLKQLSDAGSSLDEGEKKEVHAGCRQEVLEERGVLDWITRGDDDGIVARAEKFVKRRRYNGMWALEAAKDEWINEKKEDMSKSDPLMRPILVNQLSDYEEAVKKAQQMYSGKEPGELAQEALENMPKGTIVFSPKALGQDEAVRFAASPKVRAVIVGGPKDKAGPHFHRIFDQRSKLSAYYPDLEGFPVETGDYVVVDTYTKKPQVVMDPTEETRRQAHRWRRAAKVTEGKKVREAKYEAETKKTRDRDSVTIQLAGNVSDADEVPYLLGHGAKGVGLCRGEEILSKLKEITSYDSLEKHIYTEYSSMLDEIHSESLDEKRGYAVVLRAFDLGGDKVPGCVKPFFSDKDPMQYRGARVLLDNPKFFKAQAKAVLRLAYHYEETEFMIPMVEDAGQLPEFKNLWGEAKSELTEEKTQFKQDMDFGVMIETRNLAEQTPYIAAQNIKPLSVGSNDLTRDLLNLPWGKVYELRDGVEEYYDHEPPVLRYLKFIQDQGREGFEQPDSKEDKHYPIEVCGDMAGTNTGAILLIGMGYRKLSMVADRIPLVKRVIRDTPIKVMERIAGEVLQQPLLNNREVRQYVTEKMRDYADVDIESPKYTK